MRQFVVLPKSKMSLLVGDFAPAASLMSDIFTAFWYILRPFSVFFWFYCDAPRSKLSSNVFSPCTIASKLKLQIHHHHRPSGRSLGRLSAVLHDKWPQLVRGCFPGLFLRQRLSVYSKLIFSVEKLRSVLIWRKKNRQSL